MNSWKDWLTLGCICGMIVLVPLLWGRDLGSPERLTLKALDGDQVALIFIGSSTCGASQTPWLPGAIEAMKDSVQHQALALDMGFATLGVALDHDIKAGIDFVEDFGEWDEISIGGRWLNDLSLRYLIRDQPARAAIPQVVVVSRNVRVSEDFFEVGPDKVIVRIVGIPELYRWKERGFSLNLEAIREVAATDR